MILVLGVTVMAPLPSLACWLSRRDETNSLYSFLFPVSLR